MSSSKNRFPVAALIQALECEVERQIETESSEIYDAYTANRRKVLEKIVAELRRVFRGDDSPAFLMNFCSTLIVRIEKQTVYSQQPLTEVERVSVFGELSGLRSALRNFRRLLDECGVLKVRIKNH